MNLKYMEITEELYNKLDKLGLIPNDVRKSNVGKSDYSEHLIQPWSIWIDYDLNPWDADIVKRTLRTKEEPGMSAIEARIMDYDKIEHICRERKRQLTKQKPKWWCDPVPVLCDLPLMKLQLEAPHSNITYTLKGLELERYDKFRKEHEKCGPIRVCFSHESGIGPTVRCYCPKCGKEKDITDVGNW